MAVTDKTRTHTAYAFSRQGKKFGRLLEVGSGRIDRENNLVHLFMDRAPISGYTGYVVLSPMGAPPPKVEPPLLPDDDSEDDFTDDDIPPKH